MAERSGGWGTLAGIRLSVLILGDPDRTDAADAVARAFGPRHDVTVLSDKRGAIASHLQAAKAARELAPKVIHSVGARGFGSTAAPIARGIGAKLVVSLDAKDLERSRSERLAKLANIADAVLLEDEAIVDPLRSAGMKRDVYILPCPANGDEDGAFFRAIEIVYGRILAGEVDASCDEGQIVQIGGLR
jgi:hypothetical protein